MNELMERIDRLEQASRAAERRARRWQLVAGVLLALGMIVLPLQSGTAANGETVESRLAALEAKLAAVTVVGNDLFIDGKNVYIRNGLGATETTNALGNLIVGYNESAGFPRTGSHNIVVGNGHGWQSFGGLVAGRANQITGPFACVSGGASNIANAIFASVSGGQSNLASAQSASVSGGNGNFASGDAASVSGGQGNRATNLGASVSGGAANTASGQNSSVSGGANHQAPGTYNWVAGGLFQNQ